MTIEGGSTKIIKKRKSHIPKASANVIRFCEILDDLPINFRFKLEGVSKDFDGTWKKTVSDGATSWQNGASTLLNSSLFKKRDQIFEAIEREGRQVRKLYFPEKRLRLASVLTKSKLKELYFGQKKSLRDIAKDYGCTKQWIFLLMKKYGLERRTLREVNT